VVQLAKKDFNPDVAAKAVYDAVWSHKTRLQVS
jgi:hypothetical protein